MESRVPSLLGSTVDDARSRLRELKHHSLQMKTGSSSSVHGSLAQQVLFFCLPLAVGVDYDNAVRMFDTGDDMTLYRVLQRYPFLLAQDHSVVC